MVGFSGRCSPMAAICSAGVAVAPLPLPAQIDVEKLLDRSDHLRPISLNLFFAYALVAGPLTTCMALLSTVRFPVVLTVPRSEAYHQAQRKKRKVAAK